MNTYLSFDVGTTCCKCQLFNENGEILEYIAKEYQFVEIDRHDQVDIESIRNTVLAMIKEIGKRHIISSLCVSSFGESFVLLDKNDNVIFYPMLYTDNRGLEEAHEISSMIGDEKIFQRTGTIPQAMYSISKLLYIKKHYPAIFKKADKALLICDYIGYVLTGQRIIDYGLAARTGIFNIDSLSYDEEVCMKLGIDSSVFSSPKETGCIVGKVKKEILNDLEIKNEIAVVLGSHDQICNAIGAGCIHEGDAVDGIGTVECITPIFGFHSQDVSMGKEGYPIVPFLRKGCYCTYICNYACNSITNWYKNEITHNYKGENNNFFSYTEEKMDDSINELYCLPYFAGACIPYQDTNIKGAFIGLSTTTKDHEIYKSILEGLAMEMRFETENGNKFGIKPSRFIATGGGSLSKKRLQMKADIQNCEISTLRSQEGGLCGCAVLQAVALKQFETLEKACKLFVQVKDVYHPNSKKHQEYENKYQKYIKIYKQLKEIY